MNSKQKILINIKDGASNPESATISFILAVTASKSAETAVFVTSDAMHLLTNGAADEVHAAGYEPLADLMKCYIENGGKIWACPACVRAKGISEADLIDAVEIAGAPKTMAFLASGAQVLA